MATEVNGHFFADPSVHQSIEYIPGAGIRLSQATAAYTGTYSVHVNLNIGGRVEMQVQSVDVIITGNTNKTNV